MAGISLNLMSGVFEDVNIHNCNKEEINKKIKGLKWVNATTHDRAKLEIGNITITFFTGDRV